MAEGAPSPRDAQRLSAFIGTWDVAGVMSGGGDERTVIGTWTYETVAGGWGIRGVLHTDITGYGSFEEGELIGLDAATNEIHLFGLNMFGIRDHVGGWQDERTLTTRYTASDEGDTTVEDITVIFVSPRVMRAEIIECVDDEVVLTTLLDLTRVDEM
jgi:hypothetical protein